MQASILTASLLLQLKVPVVWAKAVSEQHADNATVLGDGDAVLIVGPTAKAEAFAQLR